MENALKAIEMSVACVENTSKILKALAFKYRDSGYSKALPANLPYIVPHTLFVGAGGTGKSRAALKSAELMGCCEEDNTFIKISPDSFKTAKDLVELLESKLSWDGYLCNQGNIEHSCCNNCKIIDPCNPRGPIKQQVVFIDEIHGIEKAVQVGLLMILLEFRYQIQGASGIRDVYFPKFTCFGATTDSGLLSKPLRTRFKNKVYLNYYSDEEMTEIVKVMADQKKWAISREAAVIVARCAQGIPREAENHLEGLFSCWCWCKQKDEERAAKGLKPRFSDNDKRGLTKAIALEYIKAKGFLEDGLSYDQIKLLCYLNRKVEGKYVTAGIKKIIDSMGWDMQRYADEIEPRLVNKGYIDTTRCRKITQKGVEYLDSIKPNYEQLVAA